METIFPIVGLCVLCLAVGQLGRMLISALVSAVRSWRLVARHSARIRRARAAARHARARAAADADAGAREMRQAVRRQAGREA